MSVHAGQDPRSRGLTSATFFDENGSHRNIVRGGKNSDKEWDLSGGWHYKRPKGWDKDLESRRKKRRLTGLDGKTYDVWYYDDWNADDGSRVSVDKVYDSRIGFHATNPEGDRCQKLLAKAEYAFKKELAPACHAEINEGHIRSIQYDEQFLIMRVTFVDGTICIFDRIPSAVAGTLLSAMRNKATKGYYPDGTPKHLVGILFWDYVRIRGQRHGAKYPFEYESHSKYKLTGSNGRYKVKLTREMFGAIFPNTSMALAMNAVRPFKSDETIEAVLNEEEYAKLMEGIPDPYLGASTDRYSVAGYDEKTGDIIYVDPSADPQNKYNETYEDKAPVVERTKPIVEYSESDRGRYAADVRTVLEKKLEQFLRTDEVAKAYADKVGNKELPYNVALKQLIREFGRDDLKAIIDFRRGTVNGSAIRQSGRSVDGRPNLQGTSDRMLSEMASAAFGKGAFSSWKKENEKNIYAQNLIKRYWSKDELKEMANSSRPGGIELRHSARYKKLIQDGNWEGALNYLKNNTVTLYLEDDKGHKVFAGTIHYAGSNDELIN